MDRDSGGVRYVGDEDDGQYDSLGVVYEQDNSPVSQSHASIVSATVEPQPQWSVSPRFAPTSVQLQPQSSVSPEVQLEHSSKKRNLSASPVASQQPTQQHKWQCVVM